MHTLALPPKQMLSSPPLFRHLHLHPPQKLQPQTTSYPSLHLSSSPPLPSHHTTTNRSLTACFCYSSVSSNTSTSPLSSSSEADDFDVELGRLLALLPEEMRRKASEHPELHHLIEVVMDLGRKPLARFPSGDFVLSDDLITSPDLQQAMSQVI